MQPFKSRVCQKIRQQKSSIPLDVAIQGVGIEEAVTLDIDDCVRRISASDKGLERVNFDEFYDVAPPLQGQNIFIQYNSRNYANDLLPPGWTGVHCVDYQIAKTSWLYRRFTSLPSFVTSFPLILSFVVYRELPEGLSVNLAGVVLGINPGGKVSKPGFFPLLKERPNQDQWKHIIGHDVWIIYLVLTSFAMVNQGESHMTFEKGVYQIR